MALRNCTSIIISYENYEDFVKHEIGTLKIFFFFFYRTSRDDTRILKLSSIIL